MVATGAARESLDRSYDWAKEVKEFEATKAGVKGIADSGATSIPKFFVHPPETLINPPPPLSSNGTPLELPAIDIAEAESGGARRRQVVEEICDAASSWGFFRIMNHGVPIELTDAMLAAVRKFHEQPVEAKKDLYSSDGSRKIRFTSHVPTREYDVCSWRDILTCVFQDDTLDPECIPLICRKEVLEYLKYMIKLRETMAELLSEALGLSSDYLSHLECMKSESLALLYYPPCPQPNLTMGSAKHSDATFLTLLLQDHTIGGLQILHQDHWINVPPVRGSLVANIGDLMQIVSNNKFISVQHRVLAQPIGPRVSVACFFAASSKAAAKPFAPIKELLSENNPPIYREFLCSDYFSYYKVTGLVTSALPHFKI